MLRLTENSAMGADLGLGWAPELYFNACLGTLGWG